MIKTTLDEVKKVLEENLDLGATDLTEINEDSPLFQSLGLDSLDAIEIVVILRKYYGIIIENMEQGREVFKTIGALRKFIEQNRTK
ncbi:MAG: phosphopantetheine-binding protein [Elusimicrobiota bacterium]|jgi:acyl carrier protein|nr:phosphopantetheine-binding protein [Elusimicrobiota bacterium]